MATFVRPDGAPEVVRNKHDAPFVLVFAVNPGHARPVIFRCMMFVNQFRRPVWLIALFVAICGIMLPLGCVHDAKVTNADRATPGSDIYVKQCASCQDRKSVV